MVKYPQNIAKAQVNPKCALWNKNIGVNKDEHRNQNPGMYE